MEIEKNAQALVQRLSFSEIFIDNHLNRTSMKKNIIILSILSLSIFTGCNNKYSYPTIEYGIAKFSGKIVADDSITRAKLNDFELVVSNNITSNSDRYNLDINNNGMFSIDIPIVSDNFSGLNSELYTTVIPLSPNHETVLNIHFDANGGKEVSLQTDFDYSVAEMESYMNTLLDILHISNFPIESYEMSADEYKNYALNKIAFNINRIDSINPNLTRRVKSMLINELNLYYTDMTLLSYTEIIRQKYSNHIESSGKTIASDTLDIEEPDRNYYTFLKDLDLNNTGYLSSSWFHFLLQHLLKTEALNIPPVGDKNPTEWISNLAVNMKDLVGFDSGFFYDMMLSASYANQLNNLQPFSEKQKTNIQSYFKTQPVFSITLFSENEKVILLSKSNNASSHINETPDVPTDKIMDAIISKYKGNVIFVDFWATWCGPCLNAMKEFRFVKEQFKDKNIVFLYITNETSPVKLWREKIMEIESEHYYINNDTWNYIMDSFNFDGIPTYLIYSKNGELKEKITGYPGNEEMKKKIEKVLDTE